MIAKKNRLHGWLGIGLCVALVALLGSCSNSDNNLMSDVLGLRGNEDPGFLLAADPVEIVIDTTDPDAPVDPDTGKFIATIDLLLTVLDSQESAHEGLEIFFGTSAGLLDSDGDAVLTDANGEAPDTLVVFEDDPDTIEVTATDGTRIATIILNKTVILPNQPPVADAGMDVNLECTSGEGTPVTLDGSGSSDPDSTEGTNDDIVLFEWFTDFGTPDEVEIGTGMTLDTTLELGTHTITLRVTDSEDETDTDEIVVEIVDTTPPTLSLVTDPSFLWPPNHKMREILVSADAQDACSEMTVTLVSVSSNEPDNGSGDGNTTNDIQGVEAGTEDYAFLLRSERAGGGSGRIYTIVYSIADDAGNGGDEAVAEVLVPHDMGTDRSAAAGTGNSRKPMRSTSRAAVRR